MIIIEITMCKVFRERRVLAVTAEGTVWPITSLNTLVVAQVQHPVSWAVKWTIEEQLLPPVTQL